MAATSTLPRVAVVIPTFNQASYLPSSVASAYAQTYDGPIEVWIVDDASTDETPAVIAELRTHHPDLRSIVQPRNLGISGNGSAALAAPDTEFIVRLDSDDLLDPRYLEALIPRMDAHPRAGYGHTSIQEIDEHGEALRTRRLARRTGYVDSEQALRASLAGYRTVANILLFRGSALAAVDYYRERLDSGEDYDLSIRLADAGYGNVYVSDSLACYRVWDDTAGIRARRKGLQLDGYRRIFDESIVPSWERRGWSLREVRRRRARLAAHHAASCFAAQYSPQESRELLALLLSIDDGPRVRLRVALCRRGLTGAVDRVDGLPKAMRQAIKSLAAGAASSRHRVGGSNAG